MNDHDERMGEPEHGVCTPSNIMKIESYHKIHQTFGQAVMSSFR
jgi:hypothetical protein